ncbi:MAG: T9SS type A sorting domain-containing protein [Chitinophagales bacterium]|nr:T9SS type A sorting domain-containing protein [Bacteroidota bacterium]MCB9044492.1 T9SS type A sorting domain-containing protein [Chitinophagales bacterium]
MKKILLLVLLCIVVQAQAQQRYLDEVFSDVAATKDVVYGQNYPFSFGTANLIDLKMDVYEPIGDTETERPIVVITGAGSYLPPYSLSPLGSKKDPYLIEIAHQLARRGWVAIVADYRVGWLPFGGTQTIRAKSIIQAVYRATQDMRTLARYLRKDAAENGNTFGVDVNKFVIAGSNTGAYNAVNTVYFNKEEELYLPKFLDDFGQPFVSLDTLGNFDGTGGIMGYHNPQYTEYSSNYQMILSLGGAVGDISWIDPNDIPIVSFHEMENQGTPFDCGVVIVNSTGDPIVEVCGSNAICTRALEQGVFSVYNDAVFDDPYTQVAESRVGSQLKNAFLPFPGVNFEPWGFYLCDVTGSPVPSGNPDALYCGSTSNPGNDEFVAAPYIDTVMHFFAPRAMWVLKLVGYEQFENSGVSSFVKSSLHIFPTVTQQAVQIESDNSQVEIQQVNLFDINGRKVFDSGKIKTLQYSLTRNEIPGGVYILSITTSEGIAQEKITLL